MSKDAPGADAAAKADDPDKIFEERGPKTIIRLVTVGAYMFSVSFAAITLSAYYIFLWTPPNSRLIHAHAAHLRADSEMDFFVADSLSEFRVNESHRNGHSNKLEENETNNRYKYISSPIKGVTENNKPTNLENDAYVEVIVQNEKELTKQTYAKSKRLNGGRSNIFKKMDSNIIDILETNNNSTSSISQQTTKETPTSVNVKDNSQVNFSTNRIFSNDIATSLKPALAKSSDKDSKSTERELHHSDSENTRIHKKFFNIL